MGACLGAVFGLARELLALAPVIRSNRQDAPAARMNQLTVFRIVAQRANVVAACLSLAVLCVLYLPWQGLSGLRLPTL